MFWLFRPGEDPPPGGSWRHPGQEGRPLPPGGPQEAQALPHRCGELLHTIYWPLPWHHALLTEATDLASKGGNVDEQMGPRQ